jgi:apolipoprotein N-acyltransferase
MFYLSQGLANAWPLTWFAPVPLLWLAFGGTPAWRLLAVSFLAFLIGQVYIAQCYVGAPLMSLLSLLGLRPILFPLSILFARLIHRRLSPLPTLLAFPACWTTMEFVAGLLSPHGSFGSRLCEKSSSWAVSQRLQRKRAGEMTCRAVAKGMSRPD